MDQLTIKRRLSPISLPPSNRRIQRLPNRPQPIHLRMMQPKHWIPRRSIRIIPRVSTPGIMPARMRTVKILGQGAETFEIVTAVLELVAHFGGAGVGGIDCRDVAFEAARVVSKTVGPGVDGRVERGGAEVDGPGAFAEWA